MQGLQVFDEFGDLVFDMTNRLTLVIGEIVVPANTTKTVQSSLFSEGSLYIISKNSVAGSHINYSLSGDVLTLKHIYTQVVNWVTPTAITVIYGVY